MEKDNKTELLFSIEKKYNFTQFSALEALFNCLDFNGENPKYEKNTNIILQQYKHLFSKVYLKKDIEELKVKGYSVFKWFEAYDKDVEKIGNGIELLRDNNDPEYPEIQAVLYGNKCEIAISKTGGNATDFYDKKEKALINLTEIIKKIN